MWKNHLLISNKFISGMMVGIGLSGLLYIDCNPSTKHVRKFSNVLSHIEKYHIDTIDHEKLAHLTEVAIKRLTKQLDPHTTYIDAKTNLASKVHLTSQMEGLGIEFTLLHGAIYLLGVIPNGPADRIGLQAGDQIVQIDGKSIKTENFTLPNIVEKMRGPKGTSLKITVCRGDEQRLTAMTITRDQVDIPSIDASYMVNDHIAYIKLSHFAAHTHTEFITCVNKLLVEGMKALLLDLRDNSGGYLATALKIAEEMIPPGKLILYTKGKQKDQRNYYAKGKNRLDKIPLIVLINEHTASASELLAGALQDHDRALIVGRRSFGKGLVQWPIELKDNSVLHLTVERYFTPSGRFIQKPYDTKNTYDLDLYHRYQRGEYFHADSVQIDSTLVYKTIAGRTVYGGGGIMPDCFIPLDDHVYDPTLAKLWDNYILQQYAITYARDHKKQLVNMQLTGYLNQFVVTELMLDQLLNLAKSKYLLTITLTPRIKQNIKQLIKAHIAKTLWQSQGFYRIYNQTDATCIKSLTLFNQAASLLQADQTAPQE
eukprot:gene232-310_t